MGQYIDFAYVKQHADFSAVLTHYSFDTRGDGDELRCRCPFHEDKRPSMTVNLEKKVFNCHAASCGESGNILDFVAFLEGEDLRSAATTLATICKIDLAAPKRVKGKKLAKSSTPPHKTRGGRKKPSKSKGSKSEDKEINPPLTFSLKLDPQHPYGASWSLSPPVISQFGMGYCSKGLMNRRWCIPIHDAFGELVAYIGRYPGEKVPTDQPKWLLPRGFRKELGLFNLFRVAGHSEEVVLVEGVFDTARLHSLAIPAVGLLGSSITDLQLRLLLAAGFKRAIVLLDAGSEKAERKLVHWISREIFFRMVSLPDREDPATVSEDFLHEHVPLFNAQRFQP